MADADKGVAVDLAARRWYTTTHTYGAASGIIRATEYELNTTVLSRPIHHTDYQDVGPLLLDPHTQRLFFLTDAYPGGLQVSALDGSGPRVISTAPASNRSIVPGVTSISGAARMEAPGRERHPLTSTALMKRPGFTATLCSRS